MADQVFISGGRGAGKTATMNALVTFGICEGNPGCLSFLMIAYQQDLIVAERGFRRMRDAGITGSRLYMLWNDCCKRDTRLAMDAMLTVDIDTLLEHIETGAEFQRDEVKEW